MIVNSPTLGAPAREGMLVIGILTEKIKRIVRLAGENYLDIGCGNGVFTVELGKDFRRVYGIDIEINRLREFSKKRINNNFLISQMSAEDIGFPSNFFDVITLIEVIEHIPDLHKAIRETFRVLKPHGFLCITCPNRLFPFETHGIRLMGREIGGRFPLLPYLPFLHSRFALARVFTVQDLDSFIVPLGFTRIGLDFAFPTFERGSRLGIIMRPFRGLMRMLENSSFRIFGVSIVAVYRKEGS